jgi:hypothetical protein
MGDASVIISCDRICLVAGAAMRGSMWGQTPGCHIATSPHCHPTATFATQGR